MIIIPSIDIQNGKCVRLTQGDFNQVSIYNDMPAYMAQAFCKRGAITLHIVDLDGAKQGRLTQTKYIKEIRRAFTGQLQVGGGIRTTQDIDELLALGIERVVLGSYAIQNIAQTRAWLAHYGPEKIVLALDFKIQKSLPYLAIHGWQEQTEYTLWEMLDQYPNIIYVLCTDISKDGMQTGPNLDFYQEFVQRYPHIKLQASGGIGKLQDVSQLQQLGVSAAIIGKALYENKFSLEEALQCLK